MDNLNIYAPNLNKVFESFDYYYLSPVLDNDDVDDYLTSLLVLGILEKRNSLYIVGNEWSFMILSGSRRAILFKQKLLEQEAVKRIIDYLGNDRKNDDEIVNYFNNDYTSNTIRTFLSWLETLELLQLSEGKYMNSNQEEYDEDLSDYPSLDDNINIKEDKSSIFEYLRRLNKGNIVLSPDFQRHEVWKPEQKSKFIESVLMGLPLPPIYLKKDTDTRYIVVDGLQRSSTLRDFADGNLKLEGLEPEGKNILNGVTINTIENVREGLQARFEDRQMLIYVMEPTVPMSVVYDVFNRINTGGTQLSRQEIRNCVFQGNSTRLIKDIAEDYIFKMSIDNGIRELRMKDREAVLRCLAFIVLNYELDYDGSMDKFLEKAMTKLNKMSKSYIDDLQKKALNVFNRTYKIFYDSNFRIPTDFTRGRINIAVMETIFHCFYNCKGEIDDTNVFREIFYKLLNNEDYLNAVRWSTGATNQVKTRFRLAHNAFDPIFNI